jgi:hypothetical protein
VFDVEPLASLFCLEMLEVLTFYMSDTMKQLFILRIRKIKLRRLDFKNGRLTNLAISPKHEMVLICSEEQTFQKVQHL